MKFYSNQKKDREGEGMGKKGGGEGEGGWKGGWKEGKEEKGEREEEKGWNTKLSTLNDTIASCPLATPTHPGEVISSLTEQLWKHGLSFHSTLIIMDVAVHESYHNNYFTSHF